MPGFFKEIMNGKEIILQFDDEEGRRGSNFKITIESIDSELKALVRCIEDLMKQGKNVFMVDFSDSELINEELALIVPILKKHLIKYLKVLNTYVEPEADILDIENFDEKQYQIPERIPIKKNIAMEMEESEESDKPLPFKLKWVRGKLINYK